MKNANLLNLVIVLFIAALSPAATRLVPSEHPTIQAAIDACNDGDVVIVTPGTYTGEGNRDIGFKGKAITVRSLNGPENCVIDCNAAERDLHRGFYFHSDEDANSVVDGFTIINGYAEYGGGIYCYQSTPAINSCRISGNSATDDGGGVSCDWSYPTISNSVIAGNMGWE